MIPTIYIFGYLVIFLVCTGACFFSTKGKAGFGWVQSVCGVFGVWILCETLLFHHLARHPHITDDDLFIPQVFLFLNTAFGLATVSLMSIAIYKEWFKTRPKKPMLYVFSFLALMALPSMLWLHRWTLLEMQRYRNSVNRSIEPTDRSGQTQIDPAR